MFRIKPGRIGAEAGEESLEARRFLARGHDVVGDVLQRHQAGVAAVLDDDLEAAGRAQAVERRRAEDVDQSISDLLLKRFLELGGNGVAGQVAASAACGNRRASRTWRRKFGALALSRIDWPATATVCLTPGVLRAIRLDLRA